MVELRTKSVLQQNRSQLLLSSPKAADLSQNPLENHSALQLSLLLLSTVLLPFTREENKTFAIWGQLNQIIQLIQVVFFSPWLHTQLVSDWIWCHQWGKLSNNWKVVANCEESNRTRKATVPLPLVELTGEPRIHSRCHLCCARKITSLLLTPWIFFWQLQCQKKQRNVENLTKPVSLQNITFSSTANHKLHRGQNKGKDLYKENTRKLWNHPLIKYWTKENKSH